MPALSLLLTNYTMGSLSCGLGGYTEKNLHPKRSAFWQRRNIYQIMPRRKRLKGNFG